MAGSTAVGTRLLSPRQPRHRRRREAGDHGHLQPLLRPAHGRVLRADPRAEPGHPRAAGPLRGDGRRRPPRRPLRWAAFAVGLLGAGLAVSMGLLLSRRSRRLAATSAGCRRAKRTPGAAWSSSWRRCRSGCSSPRSDGEPYYANREAERLLGRGIVPGIGSDELAEVYGVVRGRHRRALPGGRRCRWSGPSTARRPTPTTWRSAGRTPPSRSRSGGRPARAADGSVEFGIAAFADVSERRRAAQERASSSAP